MLLQQVLLNFVILKVYSQLTEAAIVDTCALLCNCRSYNGSKLDNTSTNGIEEYHPVVLIHGLISSSSDMKILEAKIKEVHKGTRVFNLNCYSEEDSLINLWQQIDIFGQEILAIGKAFPDGIHLIGYSQGGLIGRAVLQKFPQHNVRNFISLSAPQLGVYKCHVELENLPFSFWDWTFGMWRYLWIHQYCSLLNKRDNSTMTNFLHSNRSLVQLFHSRNLSDLYMKYNTFLPAVNKDISYPQESSFKRGLMKLELMVLIGGPDDGVIDPWQSAHFEFFEKFDGIPPIVPLRNSELYTKDLIGLKTLDKANRLIKYTFPTIIHRQWPISHKVADRFILPHLD